MIDNDELERQRPAALRHWADLTKHANPPVGEPIEITHSCVACGEIIAVHKHASYQEIKNCLAGLKALCAQCASWR